MKIAVRFWIYCSICTLCFVSTLRAQEPLFQRLSFTNGLPSNAVYSILEDRKGFIWIACDEGLFQYDGVHFQVFKERNQTSFSGSNLLEDRIGRIWYQNFDGKIFYVQNGCINHLPQHEKKLYYPIQITDDYLFYLSGNQLIVLEIVNLKEVKRFSFRSPISSVLLGNTYYFIDNNGLNSIDEKLNVHRLINRLPDAESMPVLFSSPTTVYLVFLNRSDNGIWKLNKNNSIERIVEFDEHQVIQSAKVYDNYFYLLTTRGVQLIPISNPSKKKVFFENRNFSDVLIDRKKNHWLTSPIDGIIIVPDLDVKQLILPSTSPFRSIKGKNELYISTKDDKIFTFKGESEPLEIFHQGNRNAEIYYLFLDSLINELIYVSSDGYTHFQPLNKKSGEKKIRHAIKQIVRLDAKYRIFTSTGSLGFFVEKSQVEQSSKWDEYIQKIPMVEIGDFYFYQLELEKLRPRGKAILYNKSEESVYFATNVGLFKWSKNGTVELKKGNDIFDIKSMFSWGEHMLGFGSDGHLQLISPVLPEKKQKFQAILEIDNIRRAKVYNGDLLLMSKDKMYHFRLDNAGNTVLKSKFELTNLECNDFAMIHGEVWIVSTNGLIKWDLRKRKESIFEGLFAVKSMQMNGDEVPLINNVFSHNENNLNIDFALLDFGNQTIEELYYQVNKSNWRHIDPSVRSLNLPELSPGNYTIRFKGLVAGTWKQFENIQFQINPPFWSSTWFIVGSMLLLFSVSFLYYRFQLRSLKVRNELINEKIQLESDLNNSLLSSIKSQMNPHFIFNALNTIQAYIFMNERDKATGYLSKFSKLTRAILQMSEKEKIRLSEELEALTLYLELEKMRFQEGFEYVIDVKEVDVEVVQIPSMLIQPFVENAIKHGLLHHPEEKRLRISIYQKAGNLYIEIDDNGIGRKRAEELKKQRNRYHESFSSQANEKRLKLLSRNTILSIQYIDKFNEYNQPTGTTVLLIIELKP